MDKNKKDKDNNIAPKNEEKEQLEEQIDVLEKQITEMENNWKRALADYKNLQRRTLKEKEEALTFANYVLISELIPIFENLKMVEKHNKDEGIKMILNQLEGILHANGVEKIEAEGKKFDEDLMEAVDTQEGEKGKVLEVVQNGYKFKGKILKPARVVVGKEKEDNFEKNEEK